MVAPAADALQNLQLHAEPRINNALLNRRTSQSPHIENCANSAGFQAILNSEITIHATESNEPAPDITLKLSSLIDYLADALNRKSHRAEIHLIGTSAAQAVGGMESLNWHLRVDGPNKTKESERDAYEQLIHQVIDDLITNSRNGAPPSAADDPKKAYPCTIQPALEGGWQCALGPRITIHFADHVFIPADVSAIDGFQVTVPGGATRCFSGNTTISSADGFQRALTHVRQRPYEGTNSPFPFIPLLHALSHGATTWEEDWQHAKDQLGRESLPNLCDAWIDFQRSHCPSNQEKWITFLHALQIAQQDPSVCVKIACIWLSTRQKLDLQEGVDFVQALAQYPRIVPDILNVIRGAFLLTWARSPEKGLQAFAFPFIAHRFKPRAFGAYPCASGMRCFLLAGPNQSDTPAEIALRLLTSLEMLSERLPASILQTSVLEPILKILDLHPITHDGSIDTLKLVQEVIDAWNKPPLRTVLQTNYHHGGLHLLTKWQTNRQLPNLDRTLAKFSRQISDKQSSIPEILSHADSIINFPTEHIKFENRSCGQTLVGIIDDLNLCKSIPIVVIEKLFVFGFNYVFTIAQARESLYTLADREASSTFNLVIQTLELNWNEVKEGRRDRNVTQDLSIQLVNNYMLKGSENYLHLAIAVIHLWLVNTSVHQHDSLSYLRQTGLQLLKKLPVKWKTLNSEPQSLSHLRKRLFKCQLLSTLHHSTRQGLFEAWPALPEHIAQTKAAAKRAHRTALKDCPKNRKSSN